MNRLGKITLGALMMAGSALGVTLATTSSADAHVSIGIGIGSPGYYGGGRESYRSHPCDLPRWRHYHQGYCGGYGAVSYGPTYNGYYDSGAYGAGYYEPVVNGFWFTDGGGRRNWHEGRFSGRGFHGRDQWHSGGHHHH